MSKYAWLMGEEGKKLHLGLMDKPVMAEKWQHGYDKSCLAESIRSYGSPHQNNHQTTGRKLHDNRKHLCKADIIYLYRKVPANIPWGDDDYTWLTNLKFKYDPAKKGHNHKPHTSPLFEDPKKLLDPAMDAIKKKEVAKLSGPEKAFIDHYSKFSHFEYKHREYIKKYKGETKVETGKTLAETAEFATQNDFKKRVIWWMNTMFGTMPVASGNKRKFENDTFVYIKYGTEGAKLYQRAGGVWTELKSLTWGKAEAKHRNFFEGFEYAQKSTNTAYKDGGGAHEIKSKTIDFTLEMTDLEEDANATTFEKYRRFYSNPTKVLSWWKKVLGEKETKILETPEFGKEFGGPAAEVLPEYGGFEAKVKEKWDWCKDYLSGMTKGQSSPDYPNVRNTNPYNQKNLRWRKYEIAIPRETGYRDYCDNLAQAVAFEENVIFQRFWQYMFVFFKWHETAEAVKNNDPFAADDTAAAKKNKENKANFLKKMKKGLKAAGKKTKGPKKKEEEAVKLSKEELEKRQRLNMQCALMMNLVEGSKLYKEYSKVKIRGKNNKNSIILVDVNSKNKNEIVNRLLAMPANPAQTFMQITPDIASALSPKIRLFKVDNSTKKEGSLSETEFVFDTFTTQNRKDRNILFNDVDRGDGCGIKEFSFNFNGTTPALARKDIKAKLVMYFQTFQDFLRIRKGPSGHFRFVDLLIRRAHDAMGFGDIQSPIHYDPSYYRIRADVGWVVRDDDQFKEILRGRGLTKTTKNGKAKVETSDFINAIKAMNKSYYLNMVDHTIDVRKDGSIEITAEYQAYIESAGKSHFLDALSTPELLNQRMEMNRKIQKLNFDGCKQVKKGTKTSQLQYILNLLSIKEELLLEKSYRSIMERLLSRGAVIKKFIETNKFKINKKTGLYKERPDLTTYSKVAKYINNDKKKKPSAAEIAIQQAGIKKTSGKLCDVFQILPPSAPVVQLNYFFLGDLVDVILDCKKGISKQKRPEVERAKVILGSFMYKGVSINLAQMPISTHYFFEWMTQNVISKKLKTFPLIRFIRTLTNHLVVDVMTDKCSGQKFDNGLQFRSTTAIGPKLGMSGAKAINYLNNIGENATMPRLNPPVPDGQSFIKAGFYNYIVVYGITGNINPKRTGDEKSDARAGVYHLHVGQNKGIVKNMSFEKTDIQYIREANFFRNGVDGLSQIGAVYNVTVEMIGNTLFYPGMHVYLNPIGIGGIEFDPRRSGVARKLGFGGYHVITKVTSTITPQGYKTTIVAQWDYSGGAGTPFSGKKKIKKLTDEKPDDSWNKKKSCGASWIKGLEADIAKLGG